jgi:hypothetical protein
MAELTIWKIWVICAQFPGTKQPELRDSLDSLYKLWKSDWFCDIGTGTHVNGLLFIAGTVRATKNNDRQRLKHWLLSNPLKHFPTAHARHSMIQE